MDRKHRMTGSDFQQVMREKKAQQVRAKRGTLFVIVTKTGETTKVGFITSTKKIGNAVARNTVRRRLRVVAREIVDQYPMGYSVILVADHGTGEQSISALSVAALSVMQRAAVRL